jgi:putative transposase
MRKLLQFLLLLAQATDKELATGMQYLKVENAILRKRLGKRVLVTPQERNRLLKFGQPVGKAIKDLITIVTPRTFAQWVSDEKEIAKGKKPKKKRKPGRPKTQEEIRKLTIKIAKENGWGVTRTLGELAKLGIFIGRSTVRNILLAAGLDPGPKRGEATWDEFIKRHAQTLWATDFFSKKVWTMRGLVDVFILFFIHVGSRKVFFAGVSAHPDNVWMQQQVKNVCMHWDGLKKDERPTMVLHDFDCKYTQDFDGILKDEEIEVMRVGPQKPNLNAFAERFVQSVKQECLNHFICFGEDHLRHITSEYVSWYNACRPHQGVGNRVLSGKKPRKYKGPVIAEEIVCEQRLGGLLKDYRRRAA